MASGTVFERRWCSPIITKATPRARSFPSPFEEAAILTLDGVGEWSTTAVGVGRGNKITLTRELQFPHSLGLLYSAFTYYCGFKVNSGEYKLMGLAPYGRPIYRDLITKHLVDIKTDGSFWMDMQYFNYCEGLTMTGPKFHELFGGPPRNPESSIEQRHMDLAASIQAVTEDVMMAMARDVHRETGMRNLVLAGGVALNCVANGRLLREGPFDDIWIQPAAGDAGGSLGAALFVWHQLLDKPRTTTGRDHQKGSLLGPRYTHRGGLRMARRHGRALSPRREPARADRAGRRSARRRKDHRLVPGPDGVRPARARRPQHSGRSPVADACRRR